MCYHIKSVLWQTERGNGLTWKKMLHKIFLKHSGPWLTWKTVQGGFNNHVDIKTREYYSLRLCALRYYALIWMISQNLYVLPCGERQTVHYFLKMLFIPREFQVRKICLMPQVLLNHWYVPLNNLLRFMHEAKCQQCSFWECDGNRKSFFESQKLRGCRE